MASKTEVIVAELELAKETKNTIKYAAPDGADPVGFDTLYVNKLAAKLMGGGSYPQMIRLTVEPMDV